MIRHHSSLEDSTVASPGSEMSRHLACYGRMGRSRSGLQDDIRESGTCPSRIGRSLREVLGSRRRLQNRQELQVERQVFMRRLFVFRSALNVVMSFMKREIFGDPKPTFLADYHLLQRFRNSHNGSVEA